MKKFIIRKVIFAKSVSAAVKLDKSTPVQDVYLDDELTLPTKSVLGFSTKKKKK